MAFLLFFFKMLFFVGISSLGVFSIFLLLFPKEENKIPFFLYSLGIGPALTTLLLYYLLLIIPNLSSVFYISSISLIYLVIITLNLKALKEYIKILLNFLKQIFKPLNIFGNLNDYFFNSNNIYFLIIFLVSILGIKNILLTMISGHDFLEYMVQAKYIFEAKSINYVSHHYNNTTGFYYVGLHGWSFPLQSTLEKMFDDITYFGFDLFFKGLTLLYGLFLLNIIYYWSKRWTNLIYAIAIIMIILLSKAYIISITSFHIDSYRMFFIVLSFFFCIQLIKETNFKQLLVFSFLAGTSAFAHSLGVFIAIIYGLCLIVFIQKKFLYRLKISIIFTLLILIFGGIHYVLDTFLGTGWIFKNLQFY